MYVRQKKNISGSISVQILEKRSGKNKLVETIGCTKESSELSLLQVRAEQRILELNPQQHLNIYTSNKDKTVENYFANESKLSIRTVGPELFLGKLFDNIGFNKIPEELFRDIVIARLVYPVSKLRTTEYLLSYRKKQVDVVSIYRFLDRFHKNYKSIVEEIAYLHTKKILSDVAIVFYDMTTLYFESEKEDELRKIGYSKDGKFQHPQIMLGLLVGENGYPIGYDIFEGNTFEGKTLIPTIEKIQKKYGFEKPIIVADSALLSKNNIESLISENYKFILGARIKNESKAIQQQILEKALTLSDGEDFIIEKAENLHLIVSYSAKRAKKDSFNRERGISRLEKQIQTKKLTKKQINNRGYNKFLVLEGNVKITIDDNKIKEEYKWDGLKGYLTNSNLDSKQIINSYNQLWKIEKAFRISKTDLRIRPIFHRKKNRIEAHICIAFVAYTVYKELERILLLNSFSISPEKAIDAIKTIYQLEYKLPDSQIMRHKIIDLNQIQSSLLNLVRSG